MAGNMKSYPHPVLGNRTDITGRYNSSYAISTDPDYVTINYDLVLKHKELEELIESDKARFLIQLECNNTFYRASHAVKDPHGQLKIPAADLRDEVDIDFYICAIEDIEDYQPSDVSPIYNGQSFFVEDGDVLAYGGSDNFPVLKSFDALRAPLTSVVDIQKGTEPKGPMHVYYENFETVTVRLSHENWADYEVASKYLIAPIHASIVLPALIDILYTMQGDKKELYEDRTWFKKLTAMCRERGYNPDDPLEAAQQLLVDPVKRSMDEYNTKFGADDIGGQL